MMPSGDNHPWKIGIPWVSSMSETEDLDITLDGLNYLDRLAFQLREVVFQFAEQVAIAQNLGMPREDIVVEPEHLQEAARSLVAMLKTEFAKHPTPPGVHLLLDSMLRPSEMGLKL